jgi:hypothetical protein
MGWGRGERREQEKDEKRSGGVQRGWEWGWQRWWWWWGRRKKDDDDEEEEGLSACACGRGGEGAKQRGERERKIHRVWWMAGGEEQKRTQDKAKEIERKREGEKASKRLSRLD